LKRDVFGPGTRKGPLVEPREQKGKNVAKNCKVAHTKKERQGKWTRKNEEDQKKKLKEKKQGRRVRGTEWKNAPTFGTSQKKH